MGNVKNVTVYLDNEQKKFHDSVRCGFIVAENATGDETFYNDLIDNSEYSNLHELINDVAGVFNVRRDVVWVAA
jgi:hypothetical protein